MLGFKALVARSRELTTKLELSATGGVSASPSATTTTTTSAAAAPPVSAPPVECSANGHELLRLRQARMDKALARHHALIDRCVDS
jgi:hypothetical protein